MGGNCPRRSAGIDGVDKSTGNGQWLNSGQQPGHLHRPRATDLSNRQASLSLGAGSPRSLPVDICLHACLFLAALVDTLLTNSEWVSASAQWRQ